MSIPQVQISDIATAAVLSLLSNEAKGFNPLFVQQAAIYGIPVDWAQLDFSDSTDNFIQGQVDPDQYESSGEISYPFACLYVLESANTNNIKFATFSGFVRVVLDVYLSWGAIRGIPNFEKYSNCLESVVVSVMNSWQNQAFSNRSLTYNGGVQCRRGPITFAGENWRQRLGFSFLFQVDEFES